MSTIPLFESDDSVEDLCLLIKGLHEEMSTVHRKVDVLLALHTNNTEALRDMVAAGPELVVPFEDEAAPVVEAVEKKSIAELQAAYDEALRQSNIMLLHGTRKQQNAANRAVDEAEQALMLARFASNPATELEATVVSGRIKKQRLPDDVRDLGKKARELHKQADAKTQQRLKTLELSKGRETKESVNLLVEEQDLRTEAVRLLSEYDRARGIIRKAKKTNPNLEVK